MFKVFMICFLKTLWSFIVSVFYFDFKEIKGLLINFNLLFAMAFVVFLDSMKEKKL